MRVHFTQGWVDGIWSPGMCVVCGELLPLQTLNVGVVSDAHLQRLIAPMFCPSSQLTTLCRKEQLCGEHPIPIFLAGCSCKRSKYCRLNPVMKQLRDSLPGKPEGFFSLRAVSHFLRKIITLGETRAIEERWLEALARVGVPRERSRLLGEEWRLCEESLSRLTEVRKEIKVGE